MFFKVEIIRTDDKAETFGRVAFSGEFATVSVVGAAGYLSQMAQACDTVGTYRVEVSHH